MYDPSAVYRTASVMSSNPAGQVVLLYEGAIRFATGHVAALERGDRLAAHHASIRCQAIIAELQQVLDISTGELAQRLDGVYAFCLRRLVQGNLAADPTPAIEVIGLMRSLLDAWRSISQAAAQPSTQLSTLPLDGRLPHLVASATTPTGSAA